MSWKARRWKEHTAGICRREGESTHHRKPRSIGGQSNEENLSELPISKHRAWHDLFRNFTAERIAEEINRRYLDPEFEFICRKRVL
jgi:hypothetical protein